MPASIFSETEWARWASFPEEIPGDDLIRAFTLTGADRDLVASRRGAANHLGLALQLCALRYLGFVPRNLSAAPRSAACFVADQLEFVIEWPLPGTADWTVAPSEKKPWLLCPDQLFDTVSKRTLSCDEWLGQQVVVFDGCGISLKDIIRTVVTYEGAHAINVARLSEIDGHKPFKPAKEPALHILNNLTLFGVRFAHEIVIESALYLYERLLDERSIQRPDGDIYVVKPGFSCPAEQAVSPRPDWLRFNGTMMMTFSSEPKLTRHTIRPVS